MRGLVKFEYFVNNVYIVYCGCRMLCRGSWYLIIFGVEIEVVNGFKYE